VETSCQRGGADVEAPSGDEPRRQAVGPMYRQHCLCLNASPSRDGGRASHICLHDLVYLPIVLLAEVVMKEVEEAFLPSLSSNQRTTPPPRPAARSGASGA